MNTSESARENKRILIFPFNLLSHYLRCLVLAGRYRDNGYEVLFLHSEEYITHIREHGYETFRADQFDSAYVMQCSAKFSFGWLNQKDIKRVYLSQKQAIEQYKPEFVIGDMAPCLKMAAEASSSKYVALMNGYMSRYYAHVRKLSRTHPAYKYLSKLPEKWADSITSLAEKRAFRKVHQPFDRLRKQYGLKKVGDFLAEMEGDENLICDLPKLFPQHSLPDNYRFIDPLMYKPNGLDSKWIPELDTSKHIICVCMGSSGDWQQLAFLNEPKFSEYTIITAGDKERVLVGSHILSRDFVDLDELLPKCSLLICHGGNGTIYAGLKAGLFMLCVSRYFEQEWNIHALERIGYGKSANDFDPEDWKKEITLAMRLKTAPFA
jgi:UDP:flavonoid glycosyltransferase YjiC (YdhE family)